jgi:membrane-bound ClpP family serine protease
MTALGLALLLMGATAVIIEAHFPALGALGAPGVVALTAGSVLAIGGLGGGVVLVVAVALLTALAGAAVVALSLRKGAAVSKRRVRSGAEGIIGRVGVVRSWGESTGKVLVDGALWHARPSGFGFEEPTAPELHAGDHVVVERLNGLTLGVRPADEWELM